MNQAAHFLFLIGLLLAVVFAVRTLEACAPKFLRWYRRAAHPFAKTLTGVCGGVLLAIFVISKDFPPNSIYNFTGTINESPYVELYSPTTLLSTTVLTNSLTPAQYRAQFALTAITNVTCDFSAPTNATLCDLGPGVHDEAYWIPLTFTSDAPWPSAVCAVPSGFVLLDDLPDRLAPSFPDLSSAVTNRVLSILQTSSGLLPPAGKLWHAATTNDSHLITWENVFLGRDTNAVANLQLELFQNGDFIYRTQFDEGGDYSAVSNWLIAAQNNGGGEVFAFADDAPVSQLETDPLPLLADSIAANPVFAHLTNSVSLHPQALELRWTYFGELDPGDENGSAADSDNDGLTDWDELFVYHTDPSNPDTDSDGLWDGEEVNQYGTSPVNSDSNNDGDLDFWQFFSPSSFTNAPWADTDGSNVFFTVMTSLVEASSSSDIAVLRIGDVLIPVRSDATLYARVAVPVGGSSPFILIPGPGLSASALAQLAVVGMDVQSATNALPYVEDPEGILDVSAFIVQTDMTMSSSMAAQASGIQIANAPRGQSGALAVGDYYVLPSVLCPHTQPDGKVKFEIRFARSKAKPGQTPLMKLQLPIFPQIASNAFWLTQSSLVYSPITTPGYHEIIVPFTAGYRGSGDFVPTVYSSVVAHYCVPVGSIPDPGTPAYDNYYGEHDDYDIPTSMGADGEPDGTKSRAHVQLDVGGTDTIPVDVEGAGAFWKRCPYCDCVEGHEDDPDKPASLYHKTDGVSVSPEMLTTNGNFVVTGLAPSTEFGGDVFTYRQAGWFNRGRYTVLGLKTYFDYYGGSVPEAHVAVGVTNALVFWTGVDLPSGDLSITLSGEGKAQLVAYNRASNRYDVLISPPATNYTCTIADWRDTYRNPTTRYVQAYLMPLTNGLCTLAQSFEGSGNDISISHSVSQPIRIHTFLAESITSETDNDGYVYNPSGIPVGGTAKFKVSLDPMTGFTEDDITWDGSGVTFVNNDNTGPEITVQGGSVGSFLLAPSVTGLRLSPFPRFHGNVMTPTTAPVTVWIVRNDSGTNAPITESAIQPIIDDANKILRQKALTLSWSGTANYTNRYEWQDITDAFNPTNAVRNALLDCSMNTGGVEIYFINTLKDAAARPIGGVNTYWGLVLAKGANPEEGGFAAHILAHEVAHQCGLLDVYETMTEKTSLVVEGLPAQVRLPYDWCGGYYSKDLSQADLTRRLLMFGVGSTFDPEPGIDIPSGPVYGLCYTNAPVTNAEIWYLDLGKVGQSDITDQTPNHH